ncbi:SDR family NAD(P)-dependent oxidoreductase [Variovorax ginsengisoli]|uniref:SDR family NAD(P)-dependent oxidoreductase n=1 Tax=Variovorax ginsengisoli TaxID=363844 RepID=A0ABT8SE40_9BURK|nr:SDR family NAD(P)-dependent oxidoreductase [Variovorax ginsengisoli]MDN8617943.1 SDR family NAD(P)-dependent oxidoreductase [Variovorax ginsengisoli]MDO1537113.1 SDR family NAD(P)-dependent oxidoreductase [Variovorax ginsengisoli]
MKASELFNVEGRVVAITGAAGGIGLAYAEVMAANGAKVNLIDIDPLALTVAVGRLRADGSEVHGEFADVTKPDTVRQAFANIVERHGRLDVVFANAGISGGPGFLNGAGERNPAGAIENLSLDVWERVIATNTTSVFLTLQTVVPYMKQQQGGGRIIVTSSISASKTETLVSSIYATSKAAVGYLVRQAAHELAKYDILVNAISPGPVITNIGGGRLKDADARKPFERAAPLGRIATTQDLQGAALYLASPASSLVTGAQILIDGGTALGPAD